MWWEENYATARVLVNVTKRMGKVYILRMHISISTFGFFKVIPLHPAPFQKCSGLIKDINADREACTTILQVLGGFGPNQKIYLSIYKALTFSASAW